MLGKSGSAPILGSAAVLITLIASAELRAVGDSIIDVRIPLNVPGTALEGHSSAVFAKEAAGVVTVHVKLDCVTENRGHASCIKTGDWLQERQIWKLLESDRFREALLSIPRNQLRVPPDSQSVEADAIGLVSFHGAERNLRFHYAARQITKDVYRVRSELELNLEDFDVRLPSITGIEQGKPIEVIVRFTLRDR